MRRKKIGFITLAALLLTGGMVPLRALDWPQWRGPRANGVSAEAGWNAASLNGTPKIVWRNKVGRGHSAISVSGNLVYTMGENTVNAGGKTTYEEVVYCLDALTGKVVWRYAYPCQSRPWPGPGSTPTVDGANLYTFGRDGELYCFNARNGRVIWKRSVTGEALARLPNWQHCASPTVAGDLLLVNAGKSGIAFNKRTGKTVWTSEAVAGGLSTPLLFDQNGKRLAAINGTGALYAVDVATGKVEWSYPWGSDCDPVILGKRIFLTGGNRGAGTTLLDITAGPPKKLWETPNLRGGFITGVPVNGCMYGIGNMGRENVLVCIDIQTGAVKWQSTLSEWGSLMSADGKLIILDGLGNLIIAEANPAKYNVLSRSKVFPITSTREQARSLIQTCWTAPVLANGKIYVRDTFGNLACVDVSR